MHPHPAAAKVLTHLSLAALSLKGEGKRGEAMQPQAVARRVTLLGFFSGRGVFFISFAFNFNAHVIAQIWQVISDTKIRTL